MPEGERAVLDAAFELTKTAPNNPNAVCTRCRSSTKPHTNAACRNRDKGESSGGKAHGNMAQGLDEPMQALLSRVQALESGQHHGGSSSAGPYGYVPPAMAAAAAGQGAAGLPKAYNKPEGNGRFKGGNFKGGGNRQTGTGCPTCGFGPGHNNGICYLEQPAAAPSSWPGPSGKCPKEAIITYIKRAIQGGLLLKLSRCADVAAR